MDQRFPKSLRLRKQNEFDRVYGSESFAADQILVIRGCANQRSETRLGLSISKRVGNAVVRNRWKRTIRESFRVQARELPEGLDIVVRPRKGAKCDFHAIRASLKKLMSRLAKHLEKSKRSSR